MYKKKLVYRHRQRSYNKIEIEMKWKIRRCQTCFNCKCRKKCIGQ